MRLQLRRAARFGALLLVLVLTCCVAAAAQDWTAHESIVLDVMDGEDITDAFNQATDRARYNPSGIHFDIQIPVGNYTAGALRVYSHTTVSMYGVTITHNSDKTTMLRLGRASADWEQANGGAGHPGYSGFTDITFLGGTFDGGGFRQAIMRFGHSTHLTLQDVTFCNVKNAHMVEMAGCRDVLVDGCTFRDFCGDWGSTTNYEALQLEVMTTQGSHFGGYYPNDDETPNENITVTQCTFENLQRGVGTHAGIAGSFFKKIRITDNEFSDITGFAVIATNYMNAEISDNNIVNCGCGIIFRTMELSHGNFYGSQIDTTKQSSYVQLNSRIMNNDISVTPGYRALFNPIAYGMQLIGEKLSKKDGVTPAGDYRVSGVTVQDNLIRVNASGYGLWVYGAAENTIADNQITLVLRDEISSAGIKLAKSTDNEIEANTIQLKNKTDMPEAVGVQIIDKSNDNIFSENRISGAPKDGLYLERSNGNCLYGNTIYKVGRDTIHLEKASGLELGQNVLKKAQRNGISMIGVKTSLIEETTISTVQDGIHLEKSKDNALTGNSISKASRDGILLALKSHRNEIDGNKIVKVKRHGISVTASEKTTIQDNRIDNAATYGIYIESGRAAKVTGNKITNAGVRARN